MWRKNGWYCRVLGSLGSLGVTTLGKLFQVRRCREHVSQAGHPLGRSATPVYGFGRSVERIPAVFTSARSICGSQLLATHAHPPAGHGLQLTTIPSAAVPLTVHTPVHDCRQSHEIGPVPQVFGAHAATGEPLAMADQFPTTLRGLAASPSPSQEQPGCPGSEAP